MREDQQAFDFKDPGATRGPVECLGQTFESEDARRHHFLTLLAAKLKDPEFRLTPGFPKGSDDDILKMSDPPYYTACPNPFIGEFVRSCNRPKAEAGEYRRQPFAVDVSVGKMNQLYQVHTYHTKVPHLAILPAIVHYTEPGDIVLDGFCGSGMSGVATNFCSVAPREIRDQVEETLRDSGHGEADWGMRRSILLDIGPAASFIAANYNLAFNTDEFRRAYESILSDFDKDLGWMYQTRHTDGSGTGKINYTIWSECFACPECGDEVVYADQAMDAETKKVARDFSCAKCSAILNKDNLQRLFDTSIDTATGQPWRRIRLKPILINYRVGKTDFEKPLDEADWAILERVQGLPRPAVFPTDKFPIEEMYHGSRLKPKGIDRIHHLFLSKATQALGFAWEAAERHPNTRVRLMLRFLFEQAIWTMTVQNLYQKGGFKQVNKYLDGVYYVPSIICEVSLRYAIEARAKRMVSVFSKYAPPHGSSIISTSSATLLSEIPDSSVDYVFTDPPFGENKFYADLNFLVESWHGVTTAPAVEAIVDGKKGKGVAEYQELMRSAFSEYCRVLKPGRWMTVVFSNSKNSIWRAIQEALGTAGFVVADVRTLDKQHGSYRQVTSSAVKQDLVISAYKPTGELSAQFSLEHVTNESAWAFVSEHLANLPVFVGRAGEAEVVLERTPQMLHDRVVAFFVQRGVAVPVSGTVFFAGLAERFPEREGMFFRQDQVSEYDRKRTTVSELRQLSLFVSDEASATQWVRQQLQAKPQTFQDLQPQFMQQLQHWAKHERTIELKELLELNFLCYDGKGPVPSQIHGYLSTNFKALRNIEKEDEALKAKAVDRWYVPDPKKEGDQEKRRLRVLLKEFGEYRASTSRKIKQFRTEAVRAGFKHCYDEQDYQTIVDVADKLPPQVIQEDEKLLMYYDVATMRLSD